MISNHDVLMCLNDIDISNKIQCPEDLCCLLKFATRLKVRSNVLEKIKDWKSEISYLILQEYKADSEYRRERVERQIATFRAIKKIISDVKLVWVKGIPLSVFVYGDETVRRAGDIDLLVPQAAVQYCVERLCATGFRKIGVANDGFNRRYSVNYFETQLRSPWGVRVEIKEESGEMNALLGREDRIHFIERIKKIEIGDISCSTTIDEYTVFHLFLSAISNSTTYFRLDDTGLREFYELSVLARKHRIDFAALRKVAMRAGICIMIYYTMKHVNLLFPDSFGEDELEMFCDNAGIKDIAYEYSVFWNTLDLTPDYFVSSEPERAKVYFRAIRKMANEYDVIRSDELLDRNLLDYHVESDDENIQFDFAVDKKLFRSGAYILLRILNSNDEYATEYGAFTDIRIAYDNQGSITTANLNFEIRTRESSEDVIKEVGQYKAEGKCYVVLSVSKIMLPKKAKRVYFNLQLYIENPNDEEDFRVTELCTMNNSLCRLASYSLDLRGEDDDKTNQGLPAGRMVWREVKAELPHKLDTRTYRDGAGNQRADLHLEVSN